LSKLLARHNKRKRGQRTFKESRARYRIAAQFRVRSLKMMLELYDLRKSDPDLPLWEVGQRFNLGAALTKDERNQGRGRDNYGAIEKKNDIGGSCLQKAEGCKEHYQRCWTRRFVIARNQVEDTLVSCEGRTRWRFR